MGKMLWEGAWDGVSYARPSCWVRFGDNWLITSPPGSERGMVWCLWLIGKLVIVTIFWKVLFNETYIAFLRFFELTWM